MELAARTDVMRDAGDTQSEDNQPEQMAAAASKNQSQTTGKTAPGKNSLSASNNTNSIPGLPGIPKDLHGVPPDLIALTFAAVSDQNLDTMRAVANAVKNRIGLNVRGLVNLRSYDDVIYQYTSINPWFDNEGYPVLDEHGYFIAGHPRPQYNEKIGRAHV